MFDAAVAQLLFEAGREDGYLFDIEVLALAQRWGYEVVEVPISWSEREGSKVRFFQDSVRMFGGLWRLRSMLRLQPEMKVPAAVGERKAA
jgi:dolichyl-phosphate beta-glucosyltransferase